MAKLVMKRYKNQEVAVAINTTESALTSFASKREKSTKNGWTIPEIVEFLERDKVDRSFTPVDKTAVEEIRAALVCFGFKNHAKEQVCVVTGRQNEEEKTDG
jgi:hypothetical protein